MRGFWRGGGDTDASRVLEEFGTDWVCLDCELMPWNAKAQGLLRSSMLRSGAGGCLCRRRSGCWSSGGKGVEVEAALERLKARQETWALYGGVCALTAGGEWFGRHSPCAVPPVATEGKTYFDRDHAGMSQRRHVSPNRVLCLWRRKHGR